MYQSLEAELHDLFWDSEGPAAELPLLKKFLARHPGQALELGCGSGRLLLPLLEEGFEIEGLDNAPTMIALCKAAAARRKLAPVLHCGELAQLPAKKRYQAVAIPAFTLQLLPDPIAAVKQIWELLAEGGGLYFSVFYPWAELEGDLPEGEFYPDHSLTLPDGKKASIATSHRLDREQQILTRTHRYQISQNEQVEREHESTQTIRYCEEADWIHLLDAMGFQLTTTFRDFLPEITESSEGKEGDESAGVTTFLAFKE